MGVEVVEEDPASISRASKASLHPGGIVTTLAYTLVTVSRPHYCLELRTEYGYIQTNVSQYNMDQYVRVKPLVTHMKQ